jgi:hypothetical protein
MISPQMTDDRLTTQFRELLPFAALIGVELLEASAELVREDGALVAKVTQTQAFHYPRDR